MKNKPFKLALAIMFIPMWGPFWVFSWLLHKTIDFLADCADEFVRAVRKINKPPA